MSTRRRHGPEAGSSENHAVTREATRPPPVTGSYSRPLIVFLYMAIATAATLFPTILYHPRLRALVYGDKKPSDNLWWQKTIIYQVYPRSFQDSDGDGVGDLNGIRQRLDYFNYLGVGAVWLSPIYKSPMVDFGYDISGFKSIDPIFGTMEDFDKFMQEAHSRGIKVIMDFIPNHSSDQHPWFQQSRKGGATNKYRDYYIWHPGKKLANGTRVPPNNWVAVFGGSMWTWDEQRQQFYLHQFTKEQPDLNWRNPKVKQSMQKIYRFWLDKGVDGFRIDALRHLYESQDLRKKEPLSYLDDVTPDQYEYYDHVHTTNLPEIKDTMLEWRKLFDDYGYEHNKYILVIAEVMDKTENIVKYYDWGADLPFNFELILLNKSCGGICIKNLVYNWIRHMPSGKWPNWVIGNHDQQRISGKVDPLLINALNMLNLLLPGTPTTYYGEEIGMLPIDLSYEQTVDPAGRNFGPNRYKEFSRDPSRSPMQWTPGINAGFSAAETTWLPIHPRFREINVEVQKEDTSENSPLQFYKKLSKLRMQTSFQEGAFDFGIVNQDVFSFIRFLDAYPGYLIALNTGTSGSKINFVKYNGHFPPKGAFMPDTGYVVYNTGNFNESTLQPGKLVNLDNVMLYPGQGAIIRFWPRGIK